MPTITIGTTPINFPDSGSDADWSPAIITFAQSVAQTLATLTSTGDIPVKVTQLTGSDNPTTDKVVSDIVFSKDLLRAAHVRYSVFRTITNGLAQENYSETGIMLILNTGNSWSKSSLLKVGDAQVDFSIDDLTGQLYITTQALTGTNHSGYVSCGAQAITKE